MPHRWGKRWPYYKSNKLKGMDAQRTSWWENILFFLRIPFYFSVYIQHLWEATDSNSHQQILDLPLLLERTSIYLLLQSLDLTLTFDHSDGVLVTVTDLIRVTSVNSNTWNSKVIIEITNLNFLISFFQCQGHQVFYSPSKATPFLFVGLRYTNWIFHISDRKQNGMVKFIIVHCNFLMLSDIL